MLYTISNTYFAFLPSNLAFIEDQRREKCERSEFLQWLQRSQRYFTFFGIGSELTALTISICICMYVYMCLTVCTIFNSKLYLYIHIYVNIHLYKQTFTKTLNGLQYYQKIDNQGTQKLSTTYDAVEIAAAIFFCCVRCTNTHSPICQSTKPKQQRHSENDARLWIFTPFV